MPLMPLWKSNRDQIESMQLHQIVKMAGDGILKDGTITAEELREFLSVVPTENLSKYLSECLEAPFTDSGLVLQDIVNELGARLDCTVQHGLYRGKAKEIGFDGIWRFPDGYSVVVEVKTTDAYAINLDKIAGYRKALISSEAISEHSSILIVVGRKDTGGLEAQVRGSRHAWDVRIISVDAFLRLVKIKESADNKATIEKIRSVLTPRELTRLDFVVDLLATTAEDIGDIAEVEEETEGVTAKREKKFTPVAFNNEVADAVGKFMGQNLKKATRSLYVSVDREIAVRALVSKTHLSGENKYYWYAFHPQYKDALNEYENTYVAFGCGAPDKVLLFPLPDFVTWLDNMNITQKEDRMYWHVHFLEQKDGSIEITFKGSVPNMNVSGKRIKI